MCSPPRSRPKSCLNTEFFMTLLLKKNLGRSEAEEDLEVLQEQTWTRVQHMQEVISGLSLPLSSALFRSRSRPRPRALSLSGRAYNTCRRSLQVSPSPSPSPSLSVTNQLIARGACISAMMLQSREAHPSLREELAYLR